MECESCTECCKLLSIDEIAKRAGVWCEHCEIGVGCKIYPERPRTCVDFRCAYHQMDNCASCLRPDKCHVVFERIADDVFLGTVNHEHPELQEVVKRQIDSLKREGFRVLLNKNPDHVFVLPQGSTDDGA